MSPYRDYELKTEAMKERWRDLQENEYEEMERYYKENRLNVYSIIKKVYHTTPQRLKNDPSIEIRDFALYMLVHFSNDPLEKIATDFKDVTVDHLLSIKNDDSLHKKYEKEKIRFFNLLKSDFLNSQYLNLAFAEDMEAML